MRRTLIAATTALALLALAGCAGGSRSTGTTGRTSNVTGGKGTAPGIRSKPLRAAAQDGTGAQVGQGTATTTADRVAIGPARILTADLTLRTKNGSAVADIADRATALVVAAGGESAGDRRSEAGSGTQADLVLKVPPAKYDATLDALSKLGKELSRSAQAEDVTDQVVDVASRVRSQEASVARIRRLLASARNLGEVVQVEGELARREADLESLKARQRALDVQTSFATITLHLRGPKAAVAPADKSPRGFVSGLKAGWRSFTAATNWLLTAVGALLPFLILLAAIGAAVLAVRRRRQPGGRASSPEPEPVTAA